MQNGQRTTLADVAAAAGTSVPTVSKVLSGRSDVSAGTRARVMRAVADLGYRGRSGRGAVPRIDRPSLVDLVLSGVEGTWANRALMGVERAATAAGVDLMLSVARRDDAWLTRLLERNLRGAVLALVDVTAEQLATLAAAQVPVVLLDPVTPPPSTVASVGAANWAGGRAAAEHLIGLGHRRLGVLGAGRRHLYSQARVDGFRSAAMQSGVESTRLRVVHIEWSEKGAATAARSLLDGAEAPTAVFACTDNIAAAVYEAAESLGLRIPEDVSVVGFDDLPEAQWLRPALTTVRQPITEMGESAMRMLLRIMADPPPDAPREELATTLIVRGSTAAR
ncbi:LacI family DNA-binding transcriptional regulator [Glycomyces harbinensis]|uniref:LacI family transcriptional regulator/LacI family transcriptional regulator, xylobiose transport system transcriptional regulator n=1 Tax=Glycomyces harbinensis TaxID=58114 RepID=A0A1G7BET4_9ACTN|nr:LacI family DNA-binding transcriptional regulator [Glycomyces harbinensis]SDE25533.1 LacI family transcriptional regulator/LacI family transcriptional regulator, xylobiose transport system transcriptional regulator [Glycomyces harbinensis]